MSKQNSPYGTSYKEVQKQKNEEKTLKEDTNILLKEITAELKSLTSAVVTIAKHIEQQ